MQYRHDLGNDRWIAEHVFPDLKGGFFIEAGATNGINGSGTYVLEKDRGWTGLCIEPIPFQFERVKEFRTCAADNRALWDISDQTLEFTIYPQKTGHSGLTETNKNWQRPGFEDEEKILLPVKTVTLSDALHQHGAPTVIDYLCLDIEGSELKVLGAFDFNGPHTIRAISIEGHACDELMLAAGYQSVKNPFTDVEFETYWLHPDI